MPTCDAPYRGGLRLNRRCNPAARTSGRLKHDDPHSGIGKLDRGVEPSQARAHYEATLDRWLERPAAVVPGTAMAYAGLPDPAKRQALIAYPKREAR